MMGNLPVRMMQVLSNIYFSAFAPHPGDTEELWCNTEKNKIKLHDRSAGVAYICHKHFFIVTMVKFFASYSNKQPHSV